MKLKYLVCLSFSLLTGCATGPAIRPGYFSPMPPAESASPTPTSEYRLQVNDVLAVKFYYHPEMNEDSLIVRPDGKISLQLIGDLQAAGKTAAILSKEIGDFYKKTLRSAEATVIVRQITKHKIYVGGEVRVPGPIMLDAPLTTLQAVFQSGGFAETADLKKVVLIRKKAEGKPDVYLCNLEEPGQDVVLQPYDIVYVPRSDVASADLFVAQYFDRLIPISRAIGFSYVYSLNPSEVSVLR